MFVTQLSFALNYFIYFPATEQKNMFSKMFAENLRNSCLVLKQINDIDIISSID